MKRLIFVFVFSFSHFLLTSIYIRHIRALIRQCDESLKTVREGLFCPSNQLEWEEKAKQMKCETFLQNCTDNNDFVYHCLINAWINGTIEVCAPRRIIAGSYCTEFSKGGARVQEQYRSKCRSCPYKYYSNESFKYQECYDLVKTTELSTKKGRTERTSSIIPDISKGVDNQTITNSNDTENQRGSGLLAVKIAVIAAVIVVIISLISLFLFDRKRRQHTKSADTKSNTEENQLKINKGFVKCLCKVAGEKPDSLRNKILESPFWNTYADSKPNSDQQTEVTGDIKEDIAIQAAAEVFNIRIYLVNQAQNEETVVCFLPKDPDAGKWMEISLDQNKKYKLLSDGNSQNEDAAQLTYHYEFSWQTKEDIQILPRTKHQEQQGEEVSSKEDPTDVLSAEEESEAS